MEPDLRISVEVAQLEMQQNLGRCMLRLQQYERLLKAMVAGMSLEGHPVDLRAVRSRQETAASKKTLGTLVGIFTDDYLTETQLTTEDETADVSPAEEETDAPSFKIRHHIVMSPERLEQTKAALAELVAIRNDLVHNLIERFDISEESGCLAATRHMQDCYQKIDGHLGELKEWAEGQAKVAELAHFLRQSKEFENAFVHGINPDGTVRWRQSTIVECLRNAESVCEEGGWTSLDAAITFIMRENPDQTPTLYGCKTWRHVFMKSELFEFRCEAGSEASRGQTWYRSRVENHVSSFVRVSPFRSRRPV